MELISRQVLELWNRYKPTIAVYAIEYDRELKKLLSTNLAEVGTDTISRQQAIDATWEEPSYTDPLNVLTEVRDRIKALPPAQPESLVNESRPLVKDTISRQAAIEALKNDMASLDHIINGMSAYDVRLDVYVSQRNQVNYDIYTINNLPPALGTNLAEVGTDCISRQAAIDATKKHYRAHDNDLLELIAFDIEQLPSAQPEIIRCRNCKFASGDSRICMKFDHSPIGELDFCAWAERRTDE